MLEFTRDDAVEAAHQFLSGLARYTECFFGEGAAARLLMIAPEQIEPAFEFCSVDDTSEPHRDPAPFNEFTFPRVIGAVYDFAEFGLAENEQEISNLISEGWTFWEIFDHGGNFVDYMAADLVHSKYIEIIDKIYKAAIARAEITCICGFEGSNIRLECLAPLAGVTVKTLRNAASNSGKYRLKLTKEGSKSVVDPKDALEWLRNRPGFNETRIGELPELESYDSVKQLGLHITTVCRHTGNTLADLVKSAGLNEETLININLIANYESSETQISLSAKELFAIGSILGFQKPKDFAIEAVKIIASNNAAQQATNELS